MNGAIVIGSQKYGKPRKDSDLDLVVCVSVEDAQILEKFAYENKAKLPFKRILDVKDERHPDDEMCDSDWTQGVPTTSDYREGDTVLNVKFAGLNLFVVTDGGKFEIWKRVNEELTAQRPIPDKSVAIRAFREAFGLELDERCVDMEDAKKIREIKLCSRPRTKK